MQEYITQLSKYFIVIFMALYTYEGFAVFRFKDENSRSGIYMRQNILLFFIQFASFLTICVKSGDLEYLFFYGIVQLMLFGVIAMTNMLYPKANKLLVNNMCMLLGVGFIMISRLSFDQAMRQFIIVLFSLIIAFFVPYCIEKFQFITKIRWMYALIGVAALSGVMILGQVTHGSLISITVAGVTFQPSEFVKILFVFFMAGSLMQDTSIKNLILTTVIAGIHVVILVASRDLGSALIFFVAFVMIVFVATRNYLYLLIGAAGGSGAAILAYNLFRHVQVRVQAWKDPWTYIDSQGYQVTQSLFAIGSGSWFGMGLMSGTPDSIPYVEKDSIFSAICEEMGVVFGLCLIMICISCFIMMMNIALKLRNRFYQLAAYGLGVMYIFQIFLTIGGGIKFIPLTGVTLPLISYGGSSVLTTLIMFYIVQGFYILRQREEERRVKRPGKGNPNRRRRREYIDFEPEYEAREEKESFEINE